MVASNLPQISNCILFFTFCRTLPSDPLSNVLWNILSGSIANNHKKQRVDVSSIIKMVSAPLFRPMKVKLLSGIFKVYSLSSFCGRSSQLLLHFHGQRSLGATASTFNLGRKPLRTWNLRRLWASNCRQGYLNRLDNWVSLHTTFKVLFAQSYRTPVLETMRVISPSSFTR